MTRRTLSLLCMVLLYLAAGANHFLNPGIYEAIMPSYLPLHRALIYISGACEILFGLLLVPVASRRIAAWLIIALLIAVFPANIQMTINYGMEHNPYLWLSILRLPAQLLLITWAWLYTKDKQLKTKRYERVIP